MFLSSKIIYRIFISIWYDSFCFTRFLSEVFVGLLVMISVSVCQIGAVNERLAVAAVH